MPTLKVLDLFAGIGGFSLGLERAGMETIAFCEIDEYRASVLRKHWPNVPILPDIREITPKSLPVRPDVLSGGFPCRDMSSARRERTGIEGEMSGLWREYARVIREVRPKYAIVENVLGFLQGGAGHWFGKFLGDVATLGYDAEWHCIPAAYVGAPHIRERVWVVLSDSDRPSTQLRNLVAKAVSDVSGQHCLWPDGLVHPSGSRRGRAYPSGSHDDHNDGISERLVRLEALGRAVVPQISEALGRAIVAQEAIHESTGKLDVQR